MGVLGIFPGFLHAQSLIETVEIPAGTFYMGSIGEGEDFDEAPVHRVTISRGFRRGTGTSGYYFTGLQDGKDRSNQCAV